jgi:Family of unknown function (DUF6152)
MNKTTCGRLAAAVLLVLSTPLVAHHGAASFDNEKTLTMKGTVTEWLWANPHCFLKVDVKDDSGAARVWNLELGNPTDITPAGYRRTTFKAGDQVTVTITPVKSGAPVGRLRSVVLPDGQTLPRQ